MKCGDGIITSPETCEDNNGANPISGDGCSSTCQLENDPAFICTTQFEFPSTPYDLTTCLGVCGDGN